MSIRRSKPSFLATCAFLAGAITATGSTPVPAIAAGLGPVATSEWGRGHVRRVLGAFAFGGHATDAQVNAWARMAPRDAVREMLDFGPVNSRLSAPEDASARHCDSITDLQALWTSSDADNPMRVSEHDRLAPLNSRDSVSASSYQRVWAKAVGTRGCNPFLHKTALFLTNYHAVVSGSEVEWGLVRAYHDDILASLVRGDDFAQLMHICATHAAVARQYGHQYARVSRRGTFYGNDDFARELLQLLFGIRGDDEQDGYHETVTIENTARILTGMNIDREPGAYGATRRESFVSPIDFSDHQDLSGRTVHNATHHPAGCLEVLHATICGATAHDKLLQLTRHALHHPESLDALPVRIASWFGNDRMTATQSAQVRESWRAAPGDLLGLLRDYASSTAFHDRNNVKFKSVFDRVLTLQNAHIASNEEVYARKNSESPRFRIRQYGLELFRPIRGIFGHQTGLDAANNRFVFKQAITNAIEDADYFHDAEADYSTGPHQTPRKWVKDWASKVPSDWRGRHRVVQVASWLWRHYIGDEGRNFDRHARLQVYSLLATGTDFMLALHPDNPERPMTAALVRSREARRLASRHRRAVIDLSSEAGKRRIGLAVGFIAMMPYTFAMEGAR